MSDLRGRLVDDPFSYRVTKAGDLMISRRGRTVLTVGGAAGVKLLKALDAAATDAAEQLVLAKATGNYKRGNER
jgi:hypothetical protein